MFTTAQLDPTRSLARIATIGSLHPANNADRLEIADVGGWQVVVRRETHHIGERVIFVEIDAALPIDDPRLNLTENMINQAKAVPGGEPEERRAVIRTIRLRGNLSQGFIIPLQNFPELADTPIGVDVSTELGIKKWDPTLGKRTAAVKGAFPSRFAEKSGAERIQNLTEQWELLTARKWVATEKLDGTSITLINDAGTALLAGRNFEIESKGHAVWDALSREDFLANTSDGEAVQGELCGPGINGNRMHLGSPTFFIFSVYRRGQLVPRTQWSSWQQQRSVPVLDLTATLPESPQELIAQVDGMVSTIDKSRLAEGVVFEDAEAAVIPSLDRTRFKVISNSYLLE